MLVPETVKYKGFEIRYINPNIGHSMNWRIFKDNECFSILALNSCKAAQNVIDTHYRHLEEEHKMSMK